MDPFSKVAIKSVKIISEDVFNIDQDLSDITEQNQCVSSIQGNSRILLYRIYISLYSLEIINTQNYLIEL